MPPVYIHRLRQRSPLLARRRWWVPWERKVDAAQLLEGRIRAVDAQVFLFSNKQQISRWYGGNGKWHGMWSSSSALWPKSSRWLLPASSGSYPSVSTTDSLSAPPGGGHIFPGPQPHPPTFFENTPTHPQPPPGTTHNPAGTLQGPYGTPHPRQSGIWPFWLGVGVPTPCPPGVWGSPGWMVPRIFLKKKKTAPNRCSCSPTPPPIRATPLPLTPPQVAAVVDQYYRQPLAGPAFLTFASVQDHLTFRRWQAQHRPPFGEVTVAPPREGRWQILPRWQPAACGVAGGGFAGL